VTLDTERVRRASVAALEPFGDERALRILEGADLAVEEDGVEWEGSTGAMKAHRVLLGVDGAALARVHTIPAVGDELEHAIAGAIAAEPGHALLEVLTYWAMRSPVAATYRAADRRRAAVDDAEHVVEATRAYLEAIDEIEAAALLAELRLSVAATRQGHVVRVLQAGPVEARRAIDDALRAVLRRPDGSSARVAWVPA
jgi:hypothetical protein